MLYLKKNYKNVTFYSMPNSILFVFSKRVNKILLNFFLLLFLILSLV